MPGLPHEGGGGVVHDPPGERVPDLLDTERRHERPVGVVFQRSLRSIRASASKLFTVTPKITSLDADPEPLACAYGRASRATMGDMAREAGITVTVT